MGLELNRFFYRSEYNVSKIVKKESRENKTSVSPLGTLPYVMTLPTLIVHIAVSVMTQPTLIVHIAVSVSVKGGDTLSLKAGIDSSTTRNLSAMALVCVYLAL